MTIARRLARWLYRLLAAIGLITVLAISTPIVSCMVGTGLLRFDRPAERGCPHSAERRSR